MKKILVVRPDRIGDVMLSTPVLEAIRQDLPGAKVSMLVRSAVVSAVKHHPVLQSVIAYDLSSTHRGWAGFKNLISEIRSGNFDAALILQVDFRVSLAVFLSGISIRSGPLSKWYSFLFFNRGLRQKRSLAHRHEADYNLELWDHLNHSAPSRRALPTQVIADAAAQQRVEGFLAKNKLTKNQFLVVHPGMGGSALNWPAQHYALLVKGLVQKGFSVVVTGSVAERDQVENILSHAESDRVHAFSGEITPDGLADLIALLSFSRLMIAPSTGPLHLAVGLGKPTVSFYSPVQVQSAKRWGPYPADVSRHQVLAPQVRCPEKYECAGERCEFYFCMRRVGVEQALNAVDSLLEKK